MQMPRLVFGETSRERELRALVEGLQAERERKDRRIAADREVHERAVSALRDAVDRGADGWNQCQRLLESAKAQRHEARRERDEAVAERDEARRLLESAKADQGCREAEEVTPNIGEQTLAILRTSQAWEQTADLLATKLSTAEGDRDEARRLLKDAKTELHEKQMKYARAVSAAQSERDEARRLLEDARAERDEARRLLEDARAERDEARAECFTLTSQKASAKRDASALLSALERVASDLRVLADDIETDNGLNDSPEDRPATDDGTAEPRPPAKPLPTSPASTASMTIVVPGRRVDLADRTANE